MAYHPDAITFADFKDEMAYHRELKTIKQKHDMPIIISGDEGSGKSIFCMALGDIDPNFYSNYMKYQQQMYFYWAKFLEANEYCTINSAIRAIEALNGDIKNRVKDTLFKKYDLDEKDIEKVETEYTLEDGSFLMYDEAGTQLFNRDHASKASKDQVKLFISNRSNRMIYGLNIPKVMYLDKYLREERTKYFIFINLTYEDNDLSKETRTAYVWGRERYKRMINFPYWWQLFDTNMGKLFKQSCPNYAIDIPDLTKTKYIPEDVRQVYDVEKTMFQLKLAKDMKEKKEEVTKTNALGEPKTQIGVVRNLPRLDEDVSAWCKRTKMHRNNYYLKIKMMEDMGIRSPS